MEIIDGDLYKYARLKIVTINTISRAVKLQVEGEIWNQEVEVEEDKRFYLKCGSQMHNDMTCNIVQGKEYKKVEKERKRVANEIQIVPYVTSASTPGSKASKEKEFVRLCPEQGDIKEFMTDRLPKEEVITGNQDKAKMENSAPSSDSDTELEPEDELDIIDES